LGFEKKRKFFHQKLSQLQKIVIITSTSGKSFTWPWQPTVWLLAPLKAEAVLGCGKGHSGKCVPVDNHMTAAFLKDK
jgi:hypothetical protein